MFRAQQIVRVIQPGALEPARAGHAVRVGEHASIVRHRANTGEFPECGPELGIVIQAPPVEGIVFRLLKPMRLRLQELLHVAPGDALG